MSVGVMILVLVSLGECCFASERELVKRLQEYLFIKDLVFFGESMLNINEYYQFVVFKEKDSFVQYLLKLNFPDRQVMIVMKLSTLEDLYLILSQVPLHKTCHYFTWLLFLENDFTCAVHIHITYDCQFIVGVKTSNYTYSLYELYRIKKDTKMICKHLAVWTSGSPIVFEPKPMYKRRWNMAGSEIVVFKDTEMECKNPGQCVQKEVWLEIAHILNFSLVLFSPSDLAKKIRVKADGSMHTLAFHTQSYRRDIVAPIVTTEINLFLKLPLLGDEISWWSFTYPLKTDVWYAVGGWIVCASALMVALTKVTTTPISSVDCGFKPFEALCTQAGSEAPAGHGLRIAYLTTHLVAIVVTSLYSACIVAIFTIQKAPQLPFMDLEGFVRDGSFTLASINETFGVTIIMSSQDPTTQMIAEQHFIGLHDMPTTYVEAVWKICHRPHYAFLAYNNDLRFLDEAVPCNIVQLPRPIFNIYTGNPIADNSSFREIFNMQLIRLRTCGVLGKIQANETQHEKQVEKSVSEAPPLNLIQVVPLLIIVPCGVVLSLALLLLEIMYARKTFIYLE